MKIRVGIGAGGGKLALECFKREQPILVSANALTNRRTKQLPMDMSMSLWDTDVALDSGGFVAMALYGKFRFHASDYAILGANNSWDWYAQMDLCCEPEIAGNRAEVEQRVAMSAELLRLNRQWAEKVADHLKVEPAYPMPVIQGWKPADYLQSIELINEVLGGNWPDLVGVGSMCRRHIHGSNSMLNILDSVDAALPAHVGVHLFGVKGQAMSYLNQYPRVVSIDSMAFEFAARQETRKSGAKRTMDLRLNHMTQWVEQQTKRYNQRHYATS